MVQDHGAGCVAWVLQVGTACVLHNYFSCLNTLNFPKCYVETDTYSHLVPSYCQQQTVILAFIMNIQQKWASNLTKFQLCPGAFTDKSFPRHKGTYT